MYKGRDTFEYSGAGHSTVINRLLAENVRIFSAKNVGGKLIIQTDTRDRQKVIVLFDALCYNYKIVSSRSTLGALDFIKKRFVIIAGVAVAVVMLLLIPRFVYSVEISADGYDENVIADTLLSLGVKRGTAVSKVDCGFAANELSKLDGVAFADVEISGSTVRVRVRRELPPTVLHDVSSDNPVVSGYDAVITRQIIFSGTAARQKGDTVKRGDTLILAEISAGDSKISVGASGEIYGLVDYTASVTFCNPHVERVKSGAYFTETVIDFIGLKGSRKGSPYALYETRVEQIKTGFLIPMVLNRVTYFEIVDKVVNEPFESVRERVIGEALAAAEKSAPDDAVIKNKKTTIREVAGDYVVEAVVTVEQRVDGLA